jgi:hypothetical protein
MVLLAGPKVCQLEKVVVTEEGRGMVRDQTPPRGQGFEAATSYIRGVYVSHEMSDILCGSRRISFHDVSSYARA